MKQEIIVPRMGESITEATIGTILKPTGSVVQVDDEIVELETDKVNQVIYAPAKGTIHLTVKAQDSVKIGQVLGFVDTEKGEIEPQKQEAAPKALEKKADLSSKALPKPSSLTVSEGVRKTRDSFIGEIKQSASKQSVSKPEKVVQEPFPEVRKSRSSEFKERETRQKMSKIRRTIADKLVEVQQTATMLTTFNEVDLTQVIILKERYKDFFLKEYQVKLGYMSFFVKASISALKAFPEINAYLDGDDLVFRNYFNIGIAVSTERGLVVPVLRDCDQMSFGEIEQEIDRFAHRARERTLNVEELQGGGFTITNGGIFGSLLSTPILNPPQTAILGMHKIVKRPVAINDQVIIRPMMYLALTYDHRVIDGREAVSFLVHIKQCLEDPARLLLEV